MNKIKQAFSFLKPTKKVETEDDYLVIKGAQYWVRLLMLFFLVCGGAIFLGGIFCTATFDAAKTTSILLIVFGAIALILGIGLLLLLNNIKARIFSYKRSVE